MTALLEYLDLLRDAWDAKLLHAKRFLTYHMRLIVLCVCPESTCPCQSETRPSRTITRRLDYVTHLKLTFQY